MSAAGSVSRSSNHDSGRTEGSAGFTARRTSMSTQQQTPRVPTEPSQREKRHPRNAAPRVTRGARVQP